jgi:hypothetical protein
MSYRDKRTGVFVVFEPVLPQALNNIAVIYHYRAEQATEKYQSEVAKLL